MKNFLEFATENKIPMTAEDVALEQEINTVFSDFLAVDDPKERRRLADQLESLRLKRSRDFVTFVDLALLRKVASEPLGAVSHPSFKWNR